MGQISRRLVALGLPLAGCAPVVRGAGAPVTAPMLNADALVMPDGARLPLYRWLPEGEPRGVLLALHGINDHATNFFGESAALFAAAGLAVYAYDQRGHGRAPHPGVWPGLETLASDATAAAVLLRARHPGLPVTLLGESMGAAVAVVAATSPTPPPIDTIVLCAPAIWGRAEMPAVMRWGLWVAAHTIPLVGFQAGSAGIAPTDNVAVMRRWSEDRFTLKYTRVDAIHGLVDLMDAAVAALPACCANYPVLVLFGGRDRIVPVPVARRVLRGAGPSARIAFYADGWHLLLRDLNRGIVAADVLAWLADRGAPLPSGADLAAAAWLDETPG